MPFPTELLTRVKQKILAVAAVPSAGLGDLTLGDAYDSSTLRFQDLATSGRVYTYMIKEGAKYEWGRGKPINSAGTWTFERTTVIRSSAGAGTKDSFTAAAIIWVTAVEADFNDRDVRGRHAVYVPAAAFGPVGNTESVTVTINGLPYSGLNFDPATQEQAVFSLAMPPSYDNTVPIRARFYWRHPAASTNFGVVWGLSGIARGDGETMGGAGSTFVNVTDTGGSTDFLYISDETAGVTPAGTPVPLDLITFRVARVAAGGADTLAVDATLFGIELIFAVKDATD